MILYKMAFYAVANGKEKGIFFSWEECKASITGYKNALYKKFDTKEAAEQFLFKNKDIIIETKKTSSTKIKKIIDDNPTDIKVDYYVYTDGACSKNGSKNAMAGLGIFFKENDNLDDLGDELSDVLFVLICLANQTGIDLEKSFKNNLSKKTDRDRLRHKSNNKLK